MSTTPHKPVRLLEAMGVLPIGERFRQARVALQGEEDVPPTQFDASSLRMMRPRLSFPMWMGRDAIRRQVVLTNLFNHTQTPVDAGWSVKCTQVRDFRGGDLTYDSHNGTDFSIAVGTEVLAPAAGRVARVVSEFNRGGLKIFIDHGHGLMTNCAHLARALVKEGDEVPRGGPIAISGYSGLDGFSTFPWGVPHVHFNTWLNGEPVDPFADATAGGETLWRYGTPLPVREGCAPGEFEDSVYDEKAIDAIIEGCRTASVRAELGAIPSLQTRAARTLIAMNYYPTRFAHRQNPYVETFERFQRLEMPFSAGRFDGAVFADEI